MPKPKELDYSDLLEKPFELGARGPDKFDCYGICLEAGMRVEICFPFSLTPADLQSQKDVSKDILKNVFEEIEKPESYCIVTFKINPPFVDHCGFVLEDSVHFLHIMRNHSVVRQRLDLYKKRIYKFYRLKINAID